MLNGNTGDSNPIESDAIISLSDNRNLAVSFVERDSELSIRLEYTDPELEGWEHLAAMGLIEAPEVTETVEFLFSRG